MARLAESIAQEENQKLQLFLNFDSEPELKEKAQEFSSEPSPLPQGEAQQALLETLQHGTRCTFAGGLLHHLFLHESQFDALMAPFPLVPQARYQSSEIMATLFHSVTQSIESLEALKLVNASEFGLLLGRSRSPDKVTLRDHLADMASLNISAELIDRFARRLLEQQRIDREVFFIDGHFLPYYGLSLIAKGYHTVRRLVMKGNELYLITDLMGRPLCFITESNEIDFRPIILRCASLLQGYGLERPVLVFDRGGYGIHFFHQLSAQADFVTWAKYVTEESLLAVPDEAFTMGVNLRDTRFLVAEERRQVAESAQTARKEGRQTPTSMELRLVVLKDVNTGKRLGLFTNNTHQPAGTIAYYMLQRWGKSENVYKELMARFYLNYHPGYDLKELENQPWVDNPDVELTRRAIRILKGECQDLEKELELCELKHDKHPDKRLARKLAELRVSLAQKQHEQTQFELKLQSLPDKVPLVELLQGRAMSRCDLEKKRLYDLMQFMAYHSRERLLELFRDCYHDPRDIKPVLDMITTRAGVVKLVGQTLMVLLDWIDNDKHREAAQRLCHAVNTLQIRLRGALDVKLSFHIARTHTR
jgi:hypothetical protein